MSDNTNVSLDSQIESIRTNLSYNTSKKIRELASLNISRSEISKILNIRYQHVRNILITPVKKVS